MIALRLFYALAWADRSHLLSAVAKSSPTANSARRCSGKAESGSSNVGKTHDVGHIFAPGLARVAALGLDPMAILVSSYTQ